MSLSTDRLDAMLTGMRALFETSYGELVKDSKWKPLVLEVKSEAAMERYNWLGSVPAMHEWKDEREIRHLLGEEYTILNKNYSAAIEVDRNDLEDDKLGLLAPRIRQLAERAAAFPNKLVFSLLDVGDSAKTFDGTAFFADTRKIGDSANIDNKLTGSGVDSADHIRTDIAAAVVAMAKYQDDRGEALELVPDTIVCPVELAIKMTEAIQPLTTGVPRPEAQYVKNIVASTWLTDATDWYFVCTTSVLKPFIFQSRKEPEFAAVNRPDSHEVFMRRRALYGVDARWGIGFLDPRTAVMVVNGS
jgi:phage major head subunit gpT-like protein